MVSPNLFSSEIVPIGRLPLGEHKNNSTSSKSIHTTVMPVQRQTNYALIAHTEQRADDEISVSSTLTVDRLDRSKHSAKKTARVHFNLSKNVEFSSPAIYEDECRKAFYSKEDYRQFKKSFIDLAKQFQSYDRKIDDAQSFKSMLVMAFHACNKATSDNPQSCFFERRRDEKALRAWLSKGSRRGLERISVMTIFADKSARRNKISAAIMEAQDNCIDMDPSERDEYIRSVAVEISRPSRLFAWRLAL